MTLSRKAQRKRERNAKIRKWLLQPAVVSGVIAVATIVVAITIAVTMEKSNMPLMAVLVSVVVVSAGYSVAIVTRRDRRSVETPSPK